ncbi:MAG: valine--tRNA ligase [Acidimicrobiales bacterium]|nr:valine--tRNA ligase [Acidimicrobiales bacterium]
MADSSLSESTVPEKPSVDGLESKWGDRWQADDIYAFDRSATRDQIFSIDTPPPTVSGSLHVGHIFAYTHTDALARYHRMQGKALFYPMGWDDNGLPTERRVQNYFGVRCDPSLPYDENFAVPDDAGNVGKRDIINVSRPNFVELCHLLTTEDEKVFEQTWRHLGLSVDWSLTYATIDDKSQRVAQRAFLRNLERGEAYQQEAPSLWDITFQTAVAQAELEDRDRDAAYHQLAFHRTASNGEGGDDIIIDTTRPELLPACVALVAHPTDERYQPLFGSTVATPIFGVEVPVLAHELADPEKGTGIAMICTFGDTTDVTWWRELDLPVRPMLNRMGRVSEDAPEGIAGPGQAAYNRLVGKTVFSAQKEIVEMLTESGELIGEPRPITHPVKFFEKGDKPLEIVTTRQWYIRNGGREDDLRQAMVDRSDQMTWHPGYMQARYKSWVDGLNGDWLISRQRFFGVPIPLWYRLDAQGEPIYDDIIAPAEATLPIDPSTDVPPGFDADQRSQAGGFIGDPDVMDTWATSSLSPQRACGWEEDDDLFERTFPMDLRPQGHDIIRTWLFSTVVRAHFEHDASPWHHTLINGWILDPDRKKMSKSKGNVVTPIGLLEEYGSDAVRYWAASGRPGTDTAFDVGQMKVGRRLAIKLLNASKFVLGLSATSQDAAAGDGAPPDASAITDPLDQSMLARLADVVDVATKAFDEYDYARPLERTEEFFWDFTDNYVELVKARAYGEFTPERAASAQAALRLALNTLQRLFAPFLPYVAEEAWSWWQTGSVHTAPWPGSDDLRAAAGSVDGGPYAEASKALAEIRKAKSEAKRSQRTAVTSLLVMDTAEGLELLGLVLDDVRGAGGIASADLVSFVERDAFGATVELEPESD